MASPSTPPSAAPPARADHVVADQSAVFAFLGDPASHRLPPGETVTRIDTHGAAVFLAGPYAYKVKRAVYFPFMDFSTLEKRRASCEAEVAINTPNAPELYLGVVPLTREATGIAFAGAGEVLDYAVKMRRFDPDQTLDRLAERGALSGEIVRALAQAVAASHRRAPAHIGWDVLGPLTAYVADNTACFAARPDLFAPADASALATAARDALEALAPLLAARSAAGFVRRCHGDLHLRNIVLIDGRPVLFDAIDFSEQIATCDVLYDLAFLLMDLWQRGLRAEANTVLNRLLWADAAPEAELDGLAALPFFLSLRAAIRAKVETAGLGHLDAALQPDAEARIRHLFRLALAFLAPERMAPTPADALPPPLRMPEAPVRLVAVGGLSGSGKSTQAARWAPFLGRAPGAVILRSDIERKRLFGVAETEPLPPEAYAPEVSPRVYQRLRDLARRALKAGQSVILDAVHARPEERAAVEAVARDLGVPFTGIWLEAPTHLLIARVEQRRDDASDADAAVVRRQEAFDIGPLSWTRLATA